MSLHDELRGTEADLRRDKQALADVQAALKEAQRELDRYSEIQSLASRLGDARLRVPAWTRRVSGKRGRKAIATLHLTDTHLDEVVRPEQVAGYNAYNRQIAGKRLRMLFEKTLVVARDYIAGVEYDGAVVLATGDIFSGDIHEELKQTNEDTLYGSCVYWVEPMVAGLKLLADDFKRLHVACVVGNHGRNTHKPIYKNRPQANIEWLFWHMVAAACKDDNRISFQIADGLSDVVTIYNTRFEIEHGDEFKGGSGISGARAPLLLGMHRTSVQRQVFQTPMDFLVVGHFHQYQPPSQGLIMGGSLKGYDEYASGKKFRPERPQQGFWITSPEHGPTVSAPIFCQDRRAEGW